MLRNLNTCAAPRRWEDVRQVQRWWQPATAICWLAVFTGLLAADEPPGFLLAPHRAVPGQDAIVTRRDASGGAAQWQIKRDHQPLVAGTDYQLIDDRTLVIPKAAAGDYQIVCAVARDGQTSIDSVLVQVQVLTRQEVGGDAARAPPAAAPSTFDTGRLNNWLVDKLEAAPISLRQKALLATAAEELSFVTGALGPEATLARFNELPAKLAGEQATPATTEAVREFFQALKYQLGSCGFDSADTQHWREAMWSLAQAASDQDMIPELPGDFGPSIAAKDTRPRVVQPGAPRPRPPWEIMVLGVVLLAGALFWVSFTVPDAIVRDSPRFREALTIWHDVIAARCLTPRAVKRFMNRVRFFAMRQRPQVEDPSHAQYIATWLRGLLGERFPPRQFPGAGAAMDEALLVAVCAVHLLEPELLNNDDLWQRLRQGLSEQPAGMPSQRYERLRQAISRHTAKYGWPLNDTHRSELRQMFAEISVT